MNCTDYGCPPLREAGKACHCAGCHETFGSLALFDSHQEACYGQSPALLCRAPEAVGLVRASNGTWWTPDGLTALTERVGRMNQARMKEAA